MLSGKVFLTGGAGFLGRAIVKRAVDENWNCSFTVFSRDTTKHHFMKRMFPDADIRYVAGDIQDYVGLVNAIHGHDVVIHAAAQKHVPLSVDQPGVTYAVNVIGSQNVLNACVEAQVESVMGISTDKACESWNPYGASKYMMEALFKEYAAIYDDIKFHLVRYGNVLASTGSFLDYWRKDMDELGYVRAVDPNMTRFWLTHDDAVSIILHGFHVTNSGWIYVPRAKSASMGDIASWVIPEGVEVKWQGNRGGEKTHETLITKYEATCSEETASGFIVYPYRKGDYTVPFTSNNCEPLTKNEFLEMIGE